MLTKLDLLKKHLITHLTDTRYVCSKCGMKFNCAQYLQDHFIQCKGEKVYVCDVCNKVFNRLDSMEVHRKTHQDKFPALPTLENLDNILEYCTEIDYDENTMFTDVLEEGEKDDYFNVMEGTIGSEVQFLENQYQLKIDETGQVTTNDIYVEKDVFEVILKKAKSNEVTYQENIDVEAGNNNNYNSKY